MQRDHYENISITKANHILSKEINFNKDIYFSHKMYLVKAITFTIRKDSTSVLCDRSKFEHNHTSETKRRIFLRRLNQNSWSNQ